MAFTLTLYKVNKRQNSTLVPSGSGTSVYVTLKQETSLNNPVFILSGNKPDANYCAFEGAFYFIDDIVSIRANLWEIICSIDVLATFAAQIRATTAFVEFAAAGHSDIMDKRIVPLSPVTQYVASANLGISQGGCYILSVIGKDGAAQYACTANQLRSMLASVENWAIGVLSTATDATEALKSGFSQLISQGSALDAVRSCRWIPYEISDLNTTDKNLWFGNFNTGITAKRLNTIIKTYGASLTVPFSRTGWLRLQPYTDVFLYLPFVGVVSINTPYFQANNEITISVSVNVVSGEIAYLVMVDSIVIGSYGGNCGASIDFGTTITPALNIANGIFQAASSLGIAAASMATPGAAALASIGAANSIVNAAQGALTPVQSSVGGIQGGVGAGLLTAASVWVLEHDISGAIGNMAEAQGLPYFKTAALSSLSGYVQTRGASVSGEIRGTLRDKINSMLDSGIFLE